MSNLSASVKATGSRFAEPANRNTGLPAGIVTPCSRTSLSEQRTLYCAGASYRSTSPIADGTLLRSSNSFCHWSGPRSRSWEPSSHFDAEAPLSVRLDEVPAFDNPGAGFRHCSRQCDGKSVPLWAIVEFRYLEGPVVIGIADALEHQNG